MVMEARPCWMELWCHMEVMMEPACPLAHAMWEWSSSRRRRELRALESDLLWRLLSKPLGLTLRWELLLRSATSSWAAAGALVEEINVDVDAPLMTS